MDTAPSESSAQRTLCYETTQHHLFAIGVTADDGHEYFFGTAQFLEAELAANAGIEENASAAPDRMQIRYATGEIVILGRGLRKVAQWLQRGELENLRPLGRRYIGFNQKGPMISSITVTRTELV